MPENPYLHSHDIAPSRDKNAVLDLLRDALIYERRAKRISLRELGRVIGCSRSALSEFESGSSKTSAIIIFKYAAAVQLEISFAAKDDFRIFDPHSHNIGTSESPHPPGVQ
jgi:transcriptional regulator with XRE-family HTH domain